MSHATVPDYEVVRRGLGRALRRLRDDCPPMETARVLLTYDGPGQPLVGLRYDGGRAIYYDAAGGQAVGVGFDGGGLEARCGRPLAELEGERAVAAWAERARYYWGWRHPRFR